MKKVENGILTVMPTVDAHCCIALKKSILNEK